MLQGSHQVAYDKAVALSEHISYKADMGSIPAGVNLRICQLIEECESVLNKLEARKSERRVL